MRRLSFIVVCCAAFQLLGPAPAQAWWGWLDELSGPGPWKGFQFDIRLVCLGSDDNKPHPAIGFETGCPIAKDGSKPRSSIGLTIRTFGAHEDPQFAANKAMRLTTLEPSFMWSVIKDPRFDFVDLGVAGGVYWFSSEGFKSFNGIVLEPLRVDLHLPPLKAPPSVLVAIAQGVIFRFGLTVFPSGFEANAFGAKGDRARRIPAETLKSIGIFMDLQPLLRKLSK